MVESLRIRHGLGWRVTTALLAVLVGSSVAYAGGAKVFRLQSQEAFLKGTLDGIAVDSLGTLQLADRAERLVEVSEPFVLSAASHPQGWVLGTGNSGNVLLIDRSGSVSTLLTTAEPEVFAVWVDSDGTVFAGSSPEGKVYRLKDGVVSEYFDPGEIYIWGLARADNGDLLVATGTNGRLYRVEAEGSGKIAFDSEDTHLRALEVLPSGEILLGTAGDGLILQLDSLDRPRTLYDAPHPEVVAFATDASGSSYAALLASEASLLDLNRQAEPAKAQDAEGSDQQEANESEASGEVTVTVSGGAQSSPVGTRPPGFKGTRSEIVRITPDGAIETVVTFKNETVYSLQWTQGRLWLGTGLDGKVFSLQNHRPVLEADVDERQIIKILDGGTGPVFATTNASAFYVVARSPSRRGTYTSPALDSGQIARFGTLRWHGRIPSGAELSFSVRSGMSSEPDRTWTDWSTPSSNREVALGGLASGRYVQWRASFKGSSGATPSLTEVTLSYIQANLPPIIESFKALDPGQILVPVNFSPTQQVFEPTSPDRQGIFTTIEPARSPDSGQRLKTLWKKGYRTFQWVVEDPNEDALRFELSFRSEESSEGWMVVAEDLEKDHYSFDSTALPDGRYRFHLRATDRPRVDDDELKTAEEISEPIVIDHSIPELVQVSVRSDGIAVRVEDRWNPLRSAEFSIDAAEWIPARVEDGLLDGQRETLLLPASEEGNLMLLRVTDAAFNVVTFDISRENR